MKRTWKRKKSQEEQEKYEKTEDLVQAYFHSMGDIPVLTKMKKKILQEK